MRSKGSTSAATDEDEVHANTHKDYHPPALDVAALPRDVAALADALTAADRLLYSAAAERAVREMRAAERATSVRLLCPAAFEALVNQTRYIGGLEEKLRHEYEDHF